MEASHVIRGTRKSCAKCITVFIYGTPLTCSLHYGYLGQTREMPE